MYLSHLGMSLKIPSLQRCSSCTSNHSWIAISTSSLQWNWPPSKCCMTGRSPETSSSTFVAFTYILNMLSQLLPTSRMSIQPFSNPLHHFLTKCTLIRPTTHVYQLAVNFNIGNMFCLSTGSEFQYRKHVLPVNWQWISIQETCFTCQLAVNFNIGNMFYLSTGSEFQYMKHVLPTKNRLCNQISHLPM